MRLRIVLISGIVMAGVISLVAWAARSPLRDAQPPARLSPAAAVDDAVAAVDAYFEQLWAEQQLVPAETADELQVLRRLSLALHGTVPSLEEIRTFEADTAPKRLRRWTGRMLADPRFADYFAQRLARSFVGTNAGAFILFRRDRFTDWLSGQLKANRPFDEIVRQMLTEQGLWTGKPASNFITQAVVDEQIDVNALAGRSVRAFLGQRIDCAQCHDHPFAQWKQSHFEGLAAYFGQVRITFAGVEDKPRIDGRPIEFTVENPETMKQRTVRPAVPFGDEWLPAEGSRRQRLAVWITHPENRRFERAVANRVWGLLFGKPYVAPVDDLPDPPPAGSPDLLDLLGADFRTHGYDLRRLVLTITASRPFRLSSAHVSLDKKEELDRHLDAWAVFPLTRLRPEQVIGSMLQAASLQTIDRNSHLFVRMVRLFRENDFIKEYGDLGENELDQRAGTIPQALLRMYGKLSHEIITANPFNATGRIAGLAPNNDACLETLYLVCLTRRPTAAEAAALLPQFAGAADAPRRQVLEDLCWALFNSWEFSWNH